MVDFRKLRSSKQQPSAVHPRDIFRRLPKPLGINDLYESQGEVLDAWFARRDEPDLLIKLHTGGGKTLVGLLIAQSALNERREPVIYLCPNRQLVQQTLTKAAEYGLAAVPYEGGGAPFNEDFLSARAVLIATYAALFNGRSRFGLHHATDFVLPAAIVLDDAHVASGVVRETFTLRINKSDAEEAYQHLAHMFRVDFQAQGRAGTFDDIVGGSDPGGVLEVPYWAWRARTEEARLYLRDKAESFPFVWPLVRDEFAHCHALLTGTSFVITPVFPLVDSFPTFKQATRRIYMSATIVDDSEIVRTFDADHETAAKNIASDSLAGVGERMILVPELARISTELTPRLLKHLAKEVAKRSGVVILVPSMVAGRQWQDIATLAESPEEVDVAVRSLQERLGSGPYVFANRYDGIDLPGDSCRLLIMSGSPQGTSEYDRFRAISFAGGNELSAAFARRIEQGIGRAARGSGDYCVVVLTGRDLIAWIGRESNLAFLTSSTRAQIDMGAEVSRDVTDARGFIQTVGQSLNRDRDWMEYHAEKLADLTQRPADSHESMQQAAAERKWFRLVRDHHFDKAIATARRYWEDHPGLDSAAKGWLEQLAARSADSWGNTELSDELQRSAYADNRNLLRPRLAPPYVRLSSPGAQAQAIVAPIMEYHARRGYLARFDELAAFLVPTASANQFEQALADFGNVLGFAAERPEKEFGVGPDVLWLLDGHLALIIEAKSRKKAKNPLSKDNHGQLLNAAEWFKQTYPGYQGLRVSLHPTGEATKAASPGETRVLTLARLNQLVADARGLIETLCDSALPADSLSMRCEQLLSASNLSPDRLPSHYLSNFRTV